MRILVHDYSGHPFQAQLSRALSRRGHDVTHSWCEAHVSGRGNLRAEPGESLGFEPIARGERIDKLSFGSRLVKELRYGVQLSRQTRRVRPDTVLVSNVPIPMLVVFVAFALLTRTSWVLWQQDVQGVAVRSFAGRQLSRVFQLVALVVAAGERWSARRADAIVVIADSFVEVHEAWGTGAKVAVIPNWAPLDEIVLRPRAISITPAPRGRAGLTFRTRTPFYDVRMLRDDAVRVVRSAAAGVDTLRAQAKRARAADWPSDLGGGRRWRRQAQRSLGGSARQSASQIGDPSA